MAWAKAGSTTLTSAGDDLDITGMTASKFNMIMIRTLRTGTGTSHNKRWLTTLDNNTATDYCWRSSYNNGTDSTSSINQANIDFCDRSEDESEEFGVIYGCNITGEEKLFYMPQRTGVFVVGSSTSGVPFTVAVAGKVDVTTNTGQYTRIDVNNDLAGSFDTGSNLSVLGSDLTPQIITPAVPFAENAQVGSRAEITDTRKIYHYVDDSTTGLKAYYKFNESSGDIINQHTTGDGLASADLTTTGVTYGVTGVISTAVSCDGSNDFMVSPSATKTDFNFIHALNQAWSINIWFKKANANDGGITALIANRVGSDVGIRIKNLDRSGSGETRKLQLEIDSGSAGSAVAMYDSNVDSFFPNDTDWHMLTITADNSITTNAMQIYLDGTLDHNVDRVGVGDGGTPEYPMNFAQEGDGTDYGDYTFDETSFWTRKLSSTNVTTLYNSGSGLAITDGVLTEWKEEGT